MHFAEALESAMGQWSEKCWFEPAERFDPIVWEGATVAEAWTDPAPGVRVEMLRRNAGRQHPTGPAHRHALSSRRIARSSERSPVSNARALLMQHLAPAASQQTAGGPKRTSRH